MRVIGGVARGRKLKPPPDRTLRPTSDRVKESIFDLLGPGAPAERVLDLFAGTGALGIEALSRGAARAVFVDADRAALALVQANLKACGLTELAQVHQQDCLRFLRAGCPGPSYDLVLMDPPYAKGLVEASLALLGEGGWLAPDARVVCETEAGLELPAGAGPLTLDRQRTYGDTAVHLFEWRDGAASDRG